MTTMSDASMTAWLDSSRMQCGYVAANFLVASADRGDRKSGKTLPVPGVHRVDDRRGDGADAEEADAHVVRTHVTASSPSCTSSCVAIDGVFDAAAAGSIIFTAATGLDVTAFAAVQAERASRLLASGVGR